VDYRKDKKEKDWKRDRKGKGKSWEIPDIGNVGEAFKVAGIEKKPFKPRTTFTKPMDTEGAPRKRETLAEKLLRARPGSFGYRDLQEKVEEIDLFLSVSACMDWENEDERDEHIKTKRSEVLAKYSKDNGYPDEILEKMIAAIDEAIQPMTISKMGWLTKVKIDQKVFITAIMDMIASRAPKK